MNWLLRRLLADIYQQIRELKMDMSILQEAVAAEDAVVARMAVFVGGLEKQIRDNANDPAAIRGIADHLGANNSALIQLMTVAAPPAVVDTPVPADVPPATAAPADPLAAPASAPAAVVADPAPAPFSSNN